MTRRPADSVADPALDLALDALKQAVSSELPSASLERRTLASFRKYRRREAWRTSIARWLTPALAYAACVMLAAYVAFVPTVPDRRGIDPASDMRPFIALQSLERIEAESSMRIIDATLPRLALNAYGVDVTPENAADGIRTQWLIGQAGELLAVRVSL